jgi:hypothetical protein
MADERVTSLRRAVAGWLAVLTPVRAELCVSFVVLAAWALVTLAISRLVRPDVVWPLSAGCLLFALSGVRFLWTIARDGLYQLTREGE